MSQGIDLTLPPELDRRKKPDLEAAREASRIHGRLLADVHIAGYNFERAMGEFIWLLSEERWKEVGFETKTAFVNSIDFSHLRVSVDQRKEVAKLLTDEGVSQRATARMLGVDETTVRRDLGTKTAAKAAKGTTDAAETNPLPSLNAANAAAWFQDNADPSKLARLREKGAKKRDARLALHASSAERNAALPVTERKYAAILADPPWQFKVWGELGKTNSAEITPTLDLAEIKKLPVADLAAEHCCLFLWVTMPMLPQTLEVIEAWGFTYKTCAFTWVKQNRGGPGFFTGQGYWTLANPELCLLATKGEPMRLGTDVHQLVVAPVAVHSRKPDEVAARIERLVAGPYLELFARRPRDGWDAWGNQA